MNIEYTIGRREQRIPPHTTGADTSGFTIRAVLICTRVMDTQHNDAIRAANPISLTQFGAFQAAPAYCLLLVSLCSDDIPYAY